MANLKDIIRARMTDKSKLDTWYQDRLKVCQSCPMNSRNHKPKGIKETIRFYWWKILNLGDDWCTVCGCSLVNKASLKASDCDLGKWEKLEIKNDLEMDYNLTNLSTDKVDLQFANREFVLNYGVIKEGSDTEVELLVEPLDNEPFVGLELKSECGCTSTRILRQGNNIKLTIGYDSKRIGEFRKLVTLDYKSDKERQIRVRIKGTVIR